MKHADSENRAHGFTLVELLITMLIMVIALFALSALKNATLRSTISAQRVTEATACAEQQLEIFNAEGYANVNSEHFYDCPDNRFRWKMESPRQIGDLDLEKIVVTVEWTGGSLEIQTLMKK